MLQHSSLLSRRFERRRPRKEAWGSRPAEGVRRSYDRRKQQPHHDDDSVLERPHHVFTTSLFSSLRWMIITVAEKASTDLITCFSVPHQFPRSNVRRVSSNLGGGASRDKHRRHKVWRFGQNVGRDSMGHGRGLVQPSADEFDRLLLGPTHYYYYSPTKSFDQITNEKENLVSPRKHCENNAAHLRHLQRLEKPCSTPPS